MLIFGFHVFPKRKIQHGTRESSILKRVQNVSFCRGNKNHQFLKQIQGKLNRRTMKGVKQLSTFF